MSVSSKELELREEFLDSLEEYISKCQEDITSMMDTLCWTPEHFMMPRKMSVCPFNSDHKMPVFALDKHKRSCEFRSQGYSKEETEQITESTSYFYEKADCVFNIKLDKETLNTVLWKHHVENHSVFYGLQRTPLTPVEEEQLLSREDRLGLAEYIISKAKEAHRLKDLEKSELLGTGNLVDLIRKDDDKGTKLNPVEEIAALRDYRRRRQTYRAKNVHITKKSHTEILREVINNQMEIYTKSIQGNTGNDEGAQDSREGEANTRYPRPRRRSRSRSGERGKRSRSRSRQRRERDRRSDSSRKRPRSRSRSEVDTDSPHNRDRSKSRSPSRSSKHKKHKHKKHKKHKHKVKEDDEDQGSPSTKDNME